MTNTDFNRIIKNACSLRELERLFISHKNNNEWENDIDDTIYWTDLIADGNQIKFQKRIAWEGINFKWIHILLQQNYNIEVHRLPFWANTLEKILSFIEINSQDIRNLNKQSVNQSTKNTKQEPFEEILTPIISYAKMDLLQTLNLSKTKSDILGDNLYKCLENNLLKQLSIICSPTLLEEFNDFRPVGYRLINNILDDHIYKSKAIYYDFINQINLIELIKKYPVLGKLIAIKVNFWITNTALFIERLLNDIDLIECAFCNEYFGGISDLNRRIDNIESFISDHHNKGLEVFIIKFSSGLKIVYKPKNISVDSRFYDLIEWINKKSSIRLKSPKLIVKDNYGWVEFIESLSCNKVDEVKMFYHRAGILLFLLHILKGNDFHNENVIAHGQFPIVIDLETLMHPNSYFETTNYISEFKNNVYEKYNNSVLRTGFLPIWQIDIENKIAFDISGLGSDFEQYTSRVMQYWRDINTDNMDVQLVYSQTREDKNLPKLNNLLIQPVNFIDEICCGFSEAYQIFLNNKIELISENGILHKFYGLKTRFIFRATVVYDTLINKLFSIEYLKSGIKRSIEIDILSRPFLNFTEKPDNWEIFLSESIAVDQMDIPYFTTFTNSRLLYSNRHNRPISNFTEKESFSWLIENVNSLTSADLNEQLSIIRSSFLAKKLQSYKKTSNDLGNTPKIKYERTYKAKPSNKNTFLEAAERIALQIEEASCIDSTNGMQWIGLEYISALDKYKLKPLGFNLYDGSTGIALFYSALYYISNNNKYRELAIKTLYPLQIYLNKDNENKSHWKDIGIGGAMGIGSIIYALTKIKYFFKDNFYDELMNKLIEDISFEQIDNDLDFDIVSGSSGLILSLLPFYEESGNNKLLKIINYASHHIINNYEVLNHDLNFFVDKPEKPLTGLSHGSAGIAYSLLRAHKITRNNSYLECGLKILKYEDYFFDKVKNNWPDFRYFDKNENSYRFMETWCHGSPGIILSRLGMLDIVPNEISIPMIINVLKKIENKSFYDVDHLCCGNLGICETFCFFSQKLYQDDFLIKARQIASWVISQKEQNGHYLISNYSNQIINYGFHQGLAGIGYELLRLSFPKTLPSILLWE